MVNNDTVGKILLWIVGIILILSSITKIIGLNLASEVLVAHNLGHVVLWIGFIELIGGILILIPIMAKFATYYLSAYFGGAIVVQLQYSQYLLLLVPFTLLLVTWVAIFLRHPESFIN